MCNGCTDTTASVARQSGHPITVLELEAPSKIEALQAGERAVSAFPRLFLDAENGRWGEKCRKIARAMVEPSPMRERFIDALERKRRGQGGVAPLARAVAPVVPLLANGGGS